MDIAEAHVICGFLKNHGVVNLENFDGGAQAASCLHIQRLLSQIDVQFAGSLAEVLKHRLICKCALFKKKTRLLRVNAATQ